MTDKDKKSRAYLELEQKILAAAIRLGSEGWDKVTYPALGAIVEKDQNTVKHYYKTMDKLVLSLQLLGLDILKKDFLNVLEMKLSNTEKVQKFAVTVYDFALNNSVLFTAIFNLNGCNFTSKSQKEALDNSYHVIFSFLKSCDPDSADEIYVRLIAIPLGYLCLKFNGLLKMDDEWLKYCIARDIDNLVCWML